ncbi:MAG: hypothetical protein SXG53_00930 [Pseudomonadota bacterium]|nr:hypothetical protein [Pseudomonadota bacterium]
MSTTGSEDWWGRGEWRGWLRRKIGWLLLAKLLGLVLLRSMFFSAEHRQSVDEAGLAQHLAIEQPQR